MFMFKILLLFINNKDRNLWKILDYLLPLQNCCNIVNSFIMSKLSTKDIYTKIELQLCNN